MERTILVTNDDGITASGIVKLARAAAKLGKVYVVAPQDQCSAMSHRITLREYIDVKEVDFPVPNVKAYATSGTPADCVRFGMLSIVDGTTDVVLSGLNCGYNSGTDIQYSATVGAALEAACSGVHALALSEAFDGPNEVADAYLDEVLRDYIDRKLGYNQVWNINFPGCKLADCKGVMENVDIAHNSFFEDTYSKEELPDGTLRLSVEGHYHEKAAPGTDFRALVDGYIAVGVVNNLSSPAGEK